MNRIIFISNAQGHMKVYKIQLTNNIKNKVHQVTYCFDLKKTACKDPY